MRNAHIEYLRFLGGFGIVWFHMHLPGEKIALSALPMFVVLFVYFGYGRPMSHAADRLLIPWAAWSVIYALAKAGQSVVEGRPLASEFEWWMVFTGTSLHLWFLVFCFGFLAIVYYFSLKINALYLVVISGLCFAAPIFITLGEPLSQWVSVLPAALFGLYLHRNKERMDKAAILVLLFFGFTIITSNQFALQTAVGSGAVLMVLCYPGKLTPLAKWMGGVSFGIYLIHPLIFALVLLIPGLALWMQLIIVFIGSVLTTMVLQRTFSRLV